MTVCYFLSAICLSSCTTSRILRRQNMAAAASSGTMNEQILHTNGGFLLPRLLVPENMMLVVIEVMLVSLAAQRGVHSSYRCCAHERLPCESLRRWCWAMCSVPGCQMVTRQNTAIRCLCSR